jgi:hypothetical protein
LTNVALVCAGAGADAVIVMLECINACIAASLCACVFFAATYVRCIVICLRADARHICSRGSRHMYIFIYIFCDTCCVLICLCASMLLCW